MSVVNFTVLMPPPNLTGVLHLGHVWNATLQDFFTRWYKLMGCKTLWGFGVDHAGLSLQIRFEKELREKSINFFEWSEEKYMEEIEKWKDSKKETIISQFKKMNFLIPYENCRYTMDEKAKKFTLEKFKELFNRGLIFQSEKLVNWDPVLKSAVSDFEVIRKEEKTKIYLISYEVVDDDLKEKRYIKIATTRPETIFGDAAIFVNPDDEKYSSFINKKVKVPIIERVIPILADKSIDKDFGTGAMKCTPAHDFLDEELGNKYSLPFIKAFDSEGIMLEAAEKFCGLNKSECKEKIIEILTKENLLEIEKHKSNISYSERTGAIIEPTLSKQWFLDCKKMTGNALKHLENEMVFVTERQQERAKMHLNSMHDWCISRQVKWGIRMPIYVKDNEVKCFIDGNIEEGFTQINDVLDTWFTSSLWALIVFGEYKYDDATNLNALITGRDILMFWVCKMLMMNGYFLKKCFFDSVILHGLILTKDGKKMSKSLNNGITPEELIEKYGSDVIRLFFLLNTKTEEDIKYDEEKLNYSRRFIHKLKNALLFFENKKIFQERTDFDSKKLLWFEVELLYRWEEIINSILINLGTNSTQIIFEEKIRNSKSYNFNHGLVIYHFEKLIKYIWYEFCNHYLELWKNLTELSENSKFFITHIWQQIFLAIQTIIPDFFEKNKKFIFKNEKTNFLLSIGHAEKRERKSYEWFLIYMNIIRRIYQKLEIPPNKLIPLNIVVENKEKFCDENECVLPHMKIMQHHEHQILVKEERSETPNVSLWINDLIFELSLEQKYIDAYSLFADEKIKKLEQEVLRSEKILTPSFIKNAKPDVVALEEYKYDLYKKELAFHKKIFLK